MKVLVALSLIFAALLAAAQTWLPISTSAAGAMVVDVASIHKQGVYLKAWSQWTSANQESEMGYPKFTWRSYKELSYYDCKNRTVAVKQVHYYDGENGTGKLVQSISYPDANLRFDDPIPGTIGQSMYELLCGQRK